MPLSNLTCTRTRRPWARPRAAAKRAEALAPDGDLGAGGERVLEVRRGERAHRQQRHLGKAAADQRRLGTGGDGEASRAAGERGRRAGVGAMAVAIGLDHGAELAVGAQLGLQPRAVALNSAEIDPGELPAPSG